jgi:predicted acylesterase/phospholipase RssA
MHKQVPVQKKKRIAFVMSGGALKAAYFHLGVAMALEECGFSFLGGTWKKNEPKTESTPMEISMYVGSSAGSSIAALLADGISIEEITHALRADQSKTKRSLPQIKRSTMFTVRRPGRAENLIDLITGKTPLTRQLRGGVEAMLRHRIKLSGLFSTEGIRDYHDKALQNTDFRALKPDLFIPATYLDRPKKVIFSRYNPSHLQTSMHTYDDSVSISNAIAASMSLPPVYAPYKLEMGDGRTEYFIDGEIHQTLSLHIPRDHGADLIIASYTHQPYTYSPAFGTLAKQGLPTIMIQSLYTIIEQKIRIAREKNENRAIVLDTVNTYLKENQFPDKKRRELTGILEQKLRHRENLDYIYIHPNPNDAALFFADHFSLSPEVSEFIVRAGFKCAMHAMRRAGIRS